MFSQWNFSWSMGQFFGSAIRHTLQKSEKLPLACLYFKFSLGSGYPHILLYWLSTHTFVQKVIIMLNVLSAYWFY